MSQLPTSESLQQLLDIMAQLRDPESGCPWDRKQDFDTIVPHTIEETFEVVDAIHQQDWQHLKEELGDLLFQIVFYAQMAKERELFDFADIIEVLNEKLKRRHPHVFSDTDVSSEEEISANWEREKAREKARAGKVEQSILDSVPTSLPALSRAGKMQKRCAKYGFDWSTLEPVVDKVREELQEVLDEVTQPAVNAEAVEDELGDLLFANVNLVRHLGYDPEVALRKANLKFEKRFKGVEEKVRLEGNRLEDYELAQLDAFWEQVKQEQRKESDR